MVTLRIIDRFGSARTSVGSTLPSLSTPTYFPAVSSTCSTAYPDALIRLLTEARFPRALISAYDCKNRLPGGLSAASKLVTSLRSAGCTVILDSGAFECQVLGKADWTLEEYDAVMSAVPHDILMSFDADSPLGTRRDSAKGRHEVTPAKKSAVQRVSVVHGHDRASLLENVGSALKAGIDSGLAIPDRDCGPDLLSRARTVAEVRRLLDGTDETLMFHILGCGNPVVMAAYVLAGADTFDSLDWAQGAIDIRSLTLTEPMLLRRTGCKCRACSTLRGSDTQLALVHNLLFYQEFGTQLRVMVRDQTLLDFLQAFTGQDYTKKIARAAFMGAQG